MKVVAIALALVLTLGSLQAMMPSPTPSANINSKSSVQGLSSPIPQPSFPTYGYTFWGGVNPGTINDTMLQKYFMPEGFHFSQDIVVANGWISNVTASGMGTLGASYCTSPWVVASSNEFVTAASYDYTMAIGS